MFSTLCMLGNFKKKRFLLIFIKFKINVLAEIISGTPSECHTVWIQIRPDSLSGLIWVQTVCKRFSGDNPSRQGVKVIFTTE